METEIVYEQLEDKGEVPMPRKPRASNQSVECPKCGKTFKALGRHKKVCTGVLIVNSDEWDKTVGDILDGFDRLKKLFMDAQGAADVYKRDLAKLTEWRGRLGNLMKGVDLDRS